MCFLAVAAVYGYIGQPMKALYAFKFVILTLSLIPNAFVTDGDPENIQITQYMSKTLLAVSGHVQSGWPALAG